MHQNSAPATQPSQRDSHSPTHTPSELRLLDVEAEPTIVASSSEHRSFNICRARPSYVGSSHWAAIFDSITELRSHFSQEEDALGQPSKLTLLLAKVPRPRLLYGALTCETPMSIMECVPPRPVCDRLISRYFNMLYIAPGMFMSLIQCTRDYVRMLPAD
jgi:hypothetical protein